jgi:probable HAF family extracellular repeat protein
VVGRSSTASGPERAFLYVDGSMYDLNELLVSDLAGDEIAFPRSINSHGQIAASACSPDRARCVAVRLDPVADLRATEVPVLSPAMLGAIAIALGSAGAWRIRRKRAR